jgi:hypothetical protein
MKAGTRMRSYKSADADRRIRGAVAQAAGIRNASQQQSFRFPATRKTIALPEKRLPGLNRRGGGGDNSTMSPRAHE